MSLRESSPQDPLVTAIIPAFNVEEFIEDAINSVLHQTYSNIEIVVIDDGSTDNTKGTIARYADVKYFYQKNSGISAARNKGIENADGEYVAFLDADDLWIPNKTEVQMNFLRNSPEYAAVASDWLVFENDTIISNSYLASRHIDPHRSFYDNLLRENIALTSTVIAKKRIVLNLGMFDVSFHPYTWEDRELMLRIAGRFKFGLVNEVLVKKRSHPNQKSKPAETVIRSLIILFNKLQKDRSVLSEESLKYIDRRLLELYVNAGYHYLENNNTKLARHFTIKAIKLNPVLLKPWKMLLKTYLPGKLVESRT